MKAITGLFRWIGRKGAVFLLLVAALLAHQLLSASYVSYGELRASVAALREGGTKLASFSRAGIDRSNADLAIAHQWTRGRIVDRREAAEVQRKQLSCASDLGEVLKKGAAGVIENRRQCIARALLTREIDTLTAVEATLDARRPGETLRQAVRRQASAMKREARVNRTALSKIKAYDDALFTRFRYRDERAAEVKRANSSATAYNAAKRNAQGLIASQARINAATAAASATVAETRAAFDRLVGEQFGLLGGNGIERARGWAERVGLERVAKQAMVALLIIIASPFLTRLLCWFVLAPIAMRRPVIRLRVPGGEAAIPLAERSTTSIGIRMGADEQLLVRQDYLQTSSGASTKATQCLLDAWHPLTSIASGLVFLTRLRGADALTTVSATRDPFAEVTLLTIPAGAACVLHPRAIAAVAHPIGRPMRINSHWRLGSLHAWLTLQLRFLVFHGPARVVVKGGRGVRVEPAMQGRVFGQDQLIGFSAGLGYSVTRTETFWPYFYGRESLLKDRVIDGDGVLIVEEAPFAGRGGKPRRGLEGALDAVTKVFGV